MLSFVWSSKYPFVAGAGGSESYTAGQIRELQRRGIPARILTIGFGEQDGREDYPDIPFVALKNKEELADLDDTLVFIIYPLHVQTKRQSYAILHCPPMSAGEMDRFFDKKGVAGKQLITSSKFAARLWRRELNQRLTHIPIAYPFAEEDFGNAKRPMHQDDKKRILFAGRLTADKGIYTLLAAPHMGSMRKLDYELTITMAGSHTDEGELIKPLIEAHPLIRLVPAARTRKDMAALLAAHDMVVIPSTDIFWKEIFGTLSVEAQHAGCRVVASNSGGLPETNCGGLVLIKPDNPQSLAQGIAKAAKLGPLTEAERLYARSKFTVEESVDSLLNIIRATEKESLHSLHKQGSFVWEQLDFAFSNMRQLSVQIARDNELAPYEPRPARNRLA